MEGQLLTEQETGEQRDPTSVDFPAGVAWEDLGLTSQDCDGWIQSGLSDPVLAARCPRSGIPPADLGMPLKGNTPLQRLQQGQSTDDVIEAIHKQLRNWNDPDSGGITTYLSADQMIRRALDCRYGVILGHLWDQLNAGLPEPLAVFLGKDEDAALYVHWIDDRPRGTFVKPNIMPPATSFMCPGHPAPEPIPITVRFGRSTPAAAVTPTCSLRPP